MKTLSRNFILLVGALMAASVVTGGAGLYGLARLDGSHQTVVFTDIPRLMTLTDLRRKIRTLVVTERDHMLEADPQRARAIEQEIDAGKTAIRALSAKYEPYLTAEDLTLWKALQDDLAGWAVLNERVLALSRDHRVAEAAALSRTHSTQWETLIMDLIANAEAQLQRASLATREVASTARISLVTAFAISTILGLIAGMFIYRAIRHTVEVVVSLKDSLVTANRGLEETNAAIEQEVIKQTHELRQELERRTRAELELRQAQKLEAVGRLAAGIAHEINTPVQFVSDSLDFLRDSAGELFGAIAKLELVQRAVLEGAAAGHAAEAAAEFAQAIDLPYLTKNVPRAFDRAHEGLSRVSTIVRSMSEFAHPDSKEMQRADLNHAIESTLVIARNEYKQVAEVETAFGELPPVQCYIGELNQAVLNIVVNAAHAIGDVVEDTGTMGGIRIETRRDGDEAVIAITDTGGGIPPEIRDRIFEPFFTTKAVGRGTGQGLAVARSVIVDMHHGTLSFETELGKGTTFLLRLPIEQAGELATARPADPQPAAARRNAEVA